MFSQLYFDLGLAIFGVCSAFVVLAVLIWAKQ